MKRFFITVLALAILGWGIYWGIGYLPDSEEAARSSIRTTRAEIRDIETVVSATGEVLPLLSSVVKSEISGRIITIPLEEGATVERGQRLLELDRTSLETREREAQRNLEAENLRLERAERNFRRLEELYAREFAGERDFLDAQTDFNLARLNLEIAQARLEDAQEDLSKTTILAPHEGIITLLPVVEGQVITGATSVSNGTDLVTISQLDALYLEANINEVDVERLKIGQEARVTFDAIPGVRINGIIRVIAPAARRDGNVRVFPIEVIFEVADGRVRPGISATVEIPIATASEVVSVLLSAVFIESSGSYVFVRESAGWKKQAVEVGINNLQYVEILSGLEAGALVALSRPAEFRGVE